MNQLTINDRSIMRGTLPNPSHLNAAMPNYHLLGQIRIYSETITPSMAKQFLSNNTGNRRLNQRAVTKYTNDMRRGEWLVKPVAICFDEQGRLGNGQHTLHAIIASGLPQLCLVATNVPRASIAMMDVGQQRTIDDIANFVGAEIDSPIAAIVRILLFGRTSKYKEPLSFSQLLEGYNYYRDAIDFACEAAGKNKKTAINAVTKAVAAMAWYTQDRSRITEFMQCLRTGDATSQGDSAAIRLRELFLSKGSQGKWEREAQLAKAKSALSMFLKYQHASRLYGIEAEIFKYPKLEAFSAELEVQP